MKQFSKKNAPNGIAMFPKIFESALNNIYFESDRSRKTRSVVELFFTKLRSQAKSAEIISLFSPICVFDLPDDFLPDSKSNHQRSCSQVHDFFDVCAILFKLKRLSLIKILAKEETAFALGEVDFISNKTQELLNFKFACKFNVENQLIDLLQIFDIASTRDFPNKDFWEFCDSFWHDDNKNH